MNRLPLTCWSFELRLKTALTWIQVPGWPRAWTVQEGSGHASRRDKRYVPPQAKLGPCAPPANSKSVVKNCSRSQLFFCLKPLVNCKHSRSRAAFPTLPTTIANAAGAHQNKSTTCLSLFSQKPAPGECIGVNCKMKFAKRDCCGLRIASCCFVGTDQLTRFV